MIYKIVFSNSPQTPTRLNCKFWLRNPPDVCAHMWGYYFGHTCVFSVATIITIKSVGRFRLPTVQLLYKATYTRGFVSETKRTFGVKNVVRVSESVRFHFFRFSVRGDISLVAEVRVCSWLFALRVSITNLMEGLSRIFTNKIF